MHSHLHIGRLSHFREDCCNERDGDGDGDGDDDGDGDGDGKVLMRNGIGTERRHDSSIKF